MISKHLKLYDFITIRQLMRNKFIVTSTALDLDISQATVSCRLKRLKGMGLFELADEEGSRKPKITGLNDNGWSLYNASKPLLRMYDEQGEA